MALSTLELVAKLGEHLEADAGILAQVGEGAVFHAQADADQAMPFMLYALPRINLRDSQGLGVAQASGQVADATIVLSVITEGPDPLGLASWRTPLTARCARGHPRAGRCSSATPSRSGVRVSWSKGKRSSRPPCNTASSWSGRDHAWDSNENLREGSHRGLGVLCIWKKRRSRVFALPAALLGTEFDA